MTRDLAVTLAADVVGYRDLKAEDNEAALHLAYECWRAFERHMDRNGGNRLAIALEASFLARFPRALDAVGCAVTLQRDLHGRAEALPVLRRCPLRIGVNHDGRREEEGNGPALTGDYVRDRLLAPAEPGGLCMSRTVHDEVGDQLNGQIAAASDASTSAGLHEQIRRIWAGIGPASAAIVTIGADALVA